jgi:hypothetical protein
MEEKNNNSTKKFLTKLNEWEKQNPKEDREFRKTMREKAGLNENDTPNIFFNEAIEQFKKLTDEIKKVAQREIK